MAANPLVYKWLSALMCYPEQELLDALPEFQAALNEWPELSANQAGLQALLNHLGSRSLRELQEDYVLVFDRTRQHADVKQHAAQPQLAAVEQFAGIAFPGVLLAVETHQAAEEKYGQADIGINAEEKLVEGIEFVHGNSFSGCLMRGGRWGRTVWFGCRWRV